MMLHRVELAHAPRGVSQNSQAFLPMREAELRSPAQRRRLATAYALEGNELRHLFSWSRVPRWDKVIGL
jgi:hypothetical protein